MMQRETLDDTIDRVARDLTATPADHRFDARAAAWRARDAASNRSWKPASVVAAALTAVLLALATINRDAKPAASPAALASRALAITSGYASSPTPSGPGVQGQAAPAARRAVVDTRRADAAVPALVIEPLVVEAVELAPLRMEGLQISDIDPEVTKEPR
jgi:hypothetical protein